MRKRLQINVTGNVEFDKIYLFPIPNLKKFEKPLIFKLG